MLHGPSDGWQLLLGMVRLCRRGLCFGSCGSAWIISAGTLVLAHQPAHRTWSLSLGITLTCWTLTVLSYLPAHEQIGRPLCAEPPGRAQICTEQCQKRDQKRSLAA